MAADMKSLAELYNVMSQPHQLSRFPPPPPTVRELVDSPNRPKVIGYPEDWFRIATPAIQALCREMIDWLVAHKGYTVVPIDIHFIAEGKIAHALTMVTNGVSHIPPSRGYRQRTASCLRSGGRRPPLTTSLRRSWAGW